MLPLRRLFILMAALAIVSCAEPSSVPTAPDIEELEDWGLSLAVIPSAPEACGVATATPLMLGNRAQSGTVEVTNDESNFYVTYRSFDGKPILATAVFVGDSSSDIPTTRRGAPRLFRFPYRSSHAWGTTEVVWEIPRSEVSGDVAVVAAFAQVGWLASWGDGDPITPGRNWATYFTHTIADCDGGGVGPAGGTVSTPGGEASITIPAGALPTNVPIEIVPATIQDLLDHIANRSGAPAAAPAAVDPLPSIEGLTPIQNTIWDFEPDGTQFHSPATVVLRYDEADLPTGLHESKLSAFLINGVIPYLPLPSMIDPVANTITAQVEHFSFVFIGYLEPEADLSVSALTESDDPIELGESVTYQATLTNLGPAAATSSVVYYQGFGDLIAGTLDADCQEITPIVSDITIRCDVGDLDVSAASLAPSVELIPQGTGTFTLWVDPGSAVTDPDITNNRFEATVDVVDPVADVSMQTFNGTPDAVDVGGNVVYSAFVAVAPSTRQTVSGATLLFSFGDATFVSASDPACFATVLGVTCPLPDLGSGIIHGVDVTLQADAAGTLVVNARVNAPFGTVDPDVTNNFLLESTTVGGAGTSDLRVSNLTESADPIELGQAVRYQATLQNYGPDAAPGAVVYYQVFGDAIAGTYNSFCEEITPIYADVTVRCQVGDLSSTDVSAAPSVQFIPQETGTFTIWVDPGSDSTDPNTENNRWETTFEVTDPVADLSMQTFTDTPDPAPVGDPVVYFANIALAPSTEQSVEGATFTMSFTGAAFVSASDPACFSTVLGVTCPLPPLGPGIIHGLDVTLLPDAAGDLSVNARVQAPFGTIDPDLTNNAVIEVTSVGGTATADLNVSNVTRLPNPVAIGQPVTLQATLRNYGPNDVSDAAAYYMVFGNVTSGGVPLSCSQISPPIVATIEVLCPVGAIDGQSGVAAAPAITVIPQAAGDFGVWVDPASSLTDPDPSNNRFETSFTASQANADLRVDRLDDTPDPVEAGGDVTYEIDAIAMGTATAVDGAVLQLLFTGSAVFQSSTLTCTPIAGGVGCPLGTLLPGLVNTVQVVMALPSIGSVGVEARIVAPAGVNDTDTSNNSRTGSTTVEAPPPNFISVGEVIEAERLVSGNDTTWFQFQGTSGQIVRIHVSRTEPGNGFNQMVLKAGTLELYPAGAAGGRATNRSSANHVTTLGATGTHRIGVTGSAGTYRVGLADGAGRLDPTYGSSGTGVVWTADDWVDMQQDGDAVFLLDTQWLTRYDATGMPDASFGTGGRVDVKAAFGTANPTSLRVQPDGKIVVAGYTYLTPYPWAIARFNTNGALDTSFGTGGIVSMGLGGNRSSARPNSIRFQQNGADLDIVVVGHPGDLQKHMGLIRLKPNGALDTGFGTGGIVFENATVEPTHVVMQSDGKITVAGSNDMVRYTADGARDTSFGVGGVLEHGIYGGQGLAVLPNDDILLLGWQSGNAFIAKWTAAGAVDGSFAGGGYSQYNFGLTNRFFDAIQDGSGNLIVVGAQTTTDNDQEWLITRMSTSGVLDPSYGHGSYTLTHFADEARVIQLDSLGRFLIAGDRVASNGGFYLARHIPN